jgi:hypothetical protein
MADETKNDPEPQDQTLVGPLNNEQVKNLLLMQASYIVQLGTDHDTLIEGIAMFLGKVVSHSSDPSGEPEASERARVQVFADLFNRARAYQQSIQGLTDMAVAAANAGTMPPSSSNVQ